MTSSFPIYFKCSKRGNFCKRATILEEMENKKEVDIKNAL